jgi:ribonucleoside-diphosphate reductase subunit M2
MYSVLIDTYVKDDNKKKILFNSMDNIPFINKKCNWAIKWIDKNNDFG